MDGKIILYGLMGGRAVEDSNFLGKLMAKRISILPTTLRGRSVDYKHKIISTFSDDPDGLPAIASGEITVRCLYIILY
jgi:tumor protein p53-inducible protein 3